jgi:2-methylcitrate dehydratase PrpD
MARIVALATCEAAERKLGEAMNDSACTLAARLGSFGRSYAIPSEEIRRQAVLCVLDTVGCMIAGSQVAEASALRPSFPLSSSPVQIARYYGYCADVFELNDLISGHASVGNVSAGLALATKDEVAGDDLVAAIAAGIEVT